MYLSIFRSIVFGTSSCLFFLVRLPVCLDRPVCLSVCLSSSLPVCLPTRLPVCLSVYLSVCSPACLPPCLPVRLPTCLSSVYLPAYLHIPPPPAFFHSLYCCRLRSRQSGDGAVVQSRGCPLDVPWLWSGRRYHAPGLFLSR